MPCNYKNYPKNWKEFSKRIRFERAKNRCEKCGIRNYSVGHREENKFCYYGGNAHLDNVSHGYEGYKESRELFDYLKDQYEGGWFEHKPTMVVLTVAHLDYEGGICKCETKCAVDSHVLALCQKCHNGLDAKARRENANRTMKIKKDSERGLFAQI